MSYQIEVRHNGLNKYRVVRGASRYEVGQRAEALQAQWNDEWARRMEVEGRRQERLDQAERRADHKTEAADRKRHGDVVRIGLHPVDRLTPDDPFRLGDPQGPADLRRARAD